MTTSAFASIDDNQLDTVSGGADRTQIEGEVNTSFGSGKGTYTRETDAVTKCMDMVKQACDTANPGTWTSSNPQAGQCTLDNLERCLKFK